MRFLIRMWRTTVLLSADTQVTDSEVCKWVYVYVTVSLCICASVHVYMHVCEFVYLSLHVCFHVYMCVHVCVHICKNQVNLKGREEIVYSGDRWMWMTMTWEHSFRLLQIPCSNAEAVSWAFYGSRIKKAIDQDPFKMHWCKHWRHGL